MKSENSSSRNKKAKVLDEIAAEEPAETMNVQNAPEEEAIPEAPETEEPVTEAPEEEAWEETESGEPAEEAAEEAPEEAEAVEESEVEEAEEPAEEETEEAAEEAEEPAEEEAEEETEAVEEPVTEPAATAAPAAPIIAEAAYGEREAKEDKEDETPSEETVRDFGSKGSLLGLSGAWFGYVVKRHWIVSLISILGFFLFIHLPDLFKVGDTDLVNAYMGSVANSTNILVNAVIYYFTIATSAMAFDYLHAQDSATIMHSLPFTRGKMFRTTIVAGYLLMLIPIAVCAASMLVLPYFSVIGCIKWFIDAVVLMSFSYAVANLAGVIAGAVWSHILLAFVLDGIPSLISMLVNVYKGMFLFGYDMGDVMNDPVVTWLSPYTHYIARNNTLTFDQLPMVAAFLGAAVLMTVVTGLLYKKVKLERERSTTVFPLVGDLLVILFSFCSLSIMALMFHAALEMESGWAGDKTVFLTTAIVSGIISFIIFRMIADGTSRIFNFKNLFKFAFFCLICAGIFAVSVFDVLGVENWSPAPAEVKRVSVSLNDYYVEDFLPKATLVQKESIENVSALHKAILANKETLQKQAEDLEPESTLKITFTTKGGQTITRTYAVMIPVKNKEIRQALNKAFKSEEYIEAYSSRLTRIARECKALDLVSNENSVRIRKDDAEALMGCYITDFRKAGINVILKYYNYSLDDGYPTPFRKTGVASLEFSSNEESYPVIVIGPKYKTTAKFLKANKYARRLAREEAEG